MKKVIVIGIVLAMVMGLAAMASAAESQWTIFLRAGVLNGTTWSYSQASSRLGVQATASTGFHASLQTNAAGIYGVDPDPAKMANKDYREAGQLAYTWNFQLETGSIWDDENKLTVGWYCPADTEAPTGWTIQVFRNGALQSTYADNEVYGSTAIKVIATDMYLDPGTKESWTIVASVPEPGSMVAMLSGLVGLVGFGIRRRK